MDWIKEETEVVYSGSDDRNHGRIIKVQKIKVLCVNIIPEDCGRCYSDFFDIL